MKQYLHRKTLVCVLFFAFSFQASAQFITTWAATGGSVTIPVRTPTYTYNYTVTWSNLTNPGTLEGTQSNITDAFTITPLEDGSIYQIEISGTYPSIYFNNTGDKDKILSVEQWGTNLWASMQEAFYGCTNLVINAADAPDLTGVISLRQTFRGCTSFNQSIESWDVSNVVEFFRMFQDASSFNQPLNGWNIASANDVSHMFLGASAFNQPLDNWNTTGVTQIKVMFQNATSFNQNINNWDVSLVTDMAGTFEGATSYNQPLNNWNVGDVTTFGNMFFGASSFDQSLGDWDMGNASSIGFMLFNSGLSTTNYSNTLIGWATQSGSLQNGVSMNANLNYNNAGQTARNILTGAPNDWAISNDTFVADLTVTNTNDSGPGSLSEAILDANAIPGSTISFNIPTSDDNWDGTYWTITPTNALTITGDETTIDGYTQPGSSVATEGTPAELRIIVNGSGKLGSTMGVNGNNITIRGLVIQEAPNNSPNLFVANGSNIKVEGCYVGTTPDGLDKDASTSVGVSVQNSSTNVTIGGTTPTERNILSGNSGVGLSEDLNNVKVIGNYIGVQPDGLTLMPTPTRGGVDINLNPGADVTIGGIAEGEGNIIAGNGLFSEDGLSTFDAEGTVTILGNSFYNNSGLGIDFISDDVTSNDGFEEPDGIQNFPVITSASQAGPDFNIQGTLISTPGTDFRLEFFSNLAADPSGFGEGEVFLGAANVTTNGSGDAPFDIDLTSVSVSPGAFITATATSFTAGPIYGSTSEFSQAFQTQRSFTTTWETTTTNETITIGTGAGTYDYTINWGDGTIQNLITGDPTHTYVTPGTYTVQITGTFPHIQLNNSGSAPKLQSIEQWGDIAWTSFSNAFNGCTNLTYNAADVPDLTAVTTMFNAFRNATSFNGDISGWDVSSVEGFASMFFNATSFDQPIGSWNTSSATNMESMFQGAASFNQPLNTWTVSNVTNMRDMFNDAVLFDQPLNSWDVSSVTDMTALFQDATAFNGAIDQWDVSSVNSMAQMFQRATGFNQPLNNWAGNTASVTDMSIMFFGADAFDQPIDQWDVSSVTTMAQMFREADLFNQDLGAWVPSSLENINAMFQNAAAFNGALDGWGANTASVTNMSQTFGGAIAFNQPLNSWNTSSVTNMSGMFQGASMFNQPLNGWNTTSVTTMSSIFQDADMFNGAIDLWDVSAVTNMDLMFFNASSFNQSLGSWNVTSVTLMGGMLSNTGLSVVNYDATLNGWASQTASLQSGVSLDVNGLVYSAIGAPGRLVLTGTNLWNIAGDTPSFPTDVSGIISTNTTWTLLGSPYNVTGSVTVDNGVTLTIEPGVIVQFNSSNTDLTINGTLLADGLPGDSIYFQNNFASIFLTASSTGSIVDHARFDNMGVFNVAALNVSSDATITNAKFEGCEVGVTILDAASPTIQDSEIVTSTDYGIRVDNGSPSISGVTIDNAALGGIWIQAGNPSITSNAISNVGNDGGIWINTADVPTIENNTFSSNARDIQADPRVLDDENFDTNGLSIIHISGSTIAGNVLWQAPQSPENWIYEVIGNILVDAGVSLTIEPGVTVQFNNSNTDLTINGTLLADGLPGDSIYFQNNFASIFLTASSTGSIVDHARFDNMGVFNVAALNVSSDATITNAKFTNCEVGVTVDNGATSTLDQLWISDATDFGILVEGTATAPSVSNSTIINNGLGLTDTGINNTGTGTVVAIDNWWGDVTGPFNSTTNASGLGNGVSDNVTFVPFLNSDPFGPPANPTALFTTEVSSTQINLSWADNSVNETDFAIFRSDGNNSSYVEIGTVEADATSYSDNTVTADNNYFYYMVARNGGGDSAPSNERAASTFAPPGNALTFDGVNDYISIPDHSAFQFGSGDFTLEAWFYFDGTDTRETLISKRNPTTPFDQYFISIGDGLINSTVGKKVYAGVLPDNRIGSGNEESVDRIVSASSDLAEGWHHTALVQGYTSGLTLYLDGQSVSTDSDSHSGGVINAIGNDLTLGSSSGTLGFFDGQMDEVRIWNMARTEAEIQSTILTGLTGNEPGLIAYYKFDQTDPLITVLPDRSINTNEGALTNFGGAATWSASGALSDPFTGEVINTNDSGPGSLRQAILSANASPGSTITFNIGSAAPWNIVLSSALPQITGIGTIIDGSTQSGWDMDTDQLIHLDGSSLVSSEVGIDVNTDNVEIYGLKITGFPSHGITTQVFANALIVGGLDRGNVISGNGFDGMRVNDVTARYNRIGTTSDGQSANGNANFGMTIGSGSIVEHNLISGHNGPGRAGIFSNASGGHTIANNFIGINAAGNAAIPNTRGIVIVTGGSSTIVNNVISGNTEAGIYSNTGFNNNDVINNIIGLDAGGTVAIPNGAGISFVGSNNRIGYKDNPNIIAENTGPAIQFGGTGTNNTWVTNAIYGNGSGIVISGGGNNGILPPTISSASATDVSGSGLDGDMIHLYLGDGNGQGESLLDSVQVTSGTWDIGGLSLGGTDQVVATATNANGTSEFSTSRMVEDLAPPSFISGFPTIPTVGTDNFDIEVQLDEIGDLYIIVAPDGDPAPTVTEIVNEELSGGGNPIGSGFINVLNPSTTFGLNIAGLSPETPYDVYVLARDAVGNLQTSPLLLEITTNQLFPDVTFTTIDVPGIDIDLGTFDNLVYQFSVTATGGDVTQQSFGFGLGGDAIPTNFAIDGWKLYESVNVDAGVGGATLVGTTNIGDVLADSVGFTLTNQILNGDTHYFYLTADISDSGSVGSTFNVGLTGPDPLESFSIADPKNKIDGGFVNGNTFTLSGDVTPPIIAIDTPIEGDDLVNAVEALDVAISGTTDAEDDQIVTVSLDDSVNPAVQVLATVASGVWTAAVADISGLDDGVITISADVDDLAGNSATSAVEMITLDKVAPSVTVADLLSNEVSPTLSGTVDDPDATIDVTVDGNSYPATNNADGTWTLVAGTITPDLIEGTYEVAVEATDLAGNMGTDASTNELVIDLTAPAVTIDELITSLASPGITGTVNDTDAVLDLIVDGSNYAPINNGDGTWSLAAGLITPLAEGVYDLVIDAMDVAGNVGTDNSENELTISQNIISFTATDITATSFTASWTQAEDVSNYTLDVSRSADFSSFVSGYEALSVPADQTSIEVSGLDFSTSYFYRVRFTNTNDVASGNSNTIALKTIIDPETVADSLALVEIFNAVNPQGLNWNSGARLIDWGGVTLDGTRTRVAGIDISSTQSAGDLPNPFSADVTTDGGLSALTTFSASDNNLTGLFDFSGTSINAVNVANNNLTFEDLEPLAGTATFTYAPQADRTFVAETNPDFLKVILNSQETVRIVPASESYSLLTNLRGFANVYNWTKDGASISGDRYTFASSFLTINGIAIDNMGLFGLTVTNTDLPDLTLNFLPESVFATADIEMRLTDFSNVLLDASERFDAALLDINSEGASYDTLEAIDGTTSSFFFNDVILGDYLCGIDPLNREEFVPTYFGDAFEWIEADTAEIRDDLTLSIQMTEDPEPPQGGEGTLDIVIEEDFGDEEARVDARRRAKRRKCGLRRRRTGGRTGQNDGEFELFAYGETNDNGEFQFGFLPEGVYRFFVEYPGIPLDPNAEVEFEVGEQGISDTEFSLVAFASEDGVEVEIDRILGLILTYFKDLEVYPNPSSDDLNIRYRHLKSADVTAELVDLTGQIKWSQDLQNGYNGNLTIDVSEYPAGIYILRFYDRNSKNEHVVGYRVLKR